MMEINPDKVLEYIDWFITNQIIKYGGSNKWREREECRCGPATYATLLHSFLPDQNLKEDLYRFKDCRLFLDPYYPEGILVFWPCVIEIPNIPYVLDGVLISATPA